MSAAWRLAWRMLRRDWRAGELTVLGVALLLAVAALTSVGFLTDRAERALQLEAHRLLGGDLLLTADHPWSETMRRDIAARGLAIAESVVFPSMTMHGSALSLAEIKAVSSNYPLRGRLRIASEPNRADAETLSTPPRGAAWADERLTTALALEPGATLNLGQLKLRFAAVLTQEPDRGMNVFALAPRLMIDLDDLPASGLIQTGSRVTYRLHLAGDAAAVAALAEWIGPRLARGEKLESLENARPEVRTIIQRAQSFLRVAALLAVVLAAVAVALAAERYLQRHLDGCAVMRCMGAKESQLLAIHGGEFLLFGLMATALGCGLGYGVQAALGVWLTGFLQAELPPPSWLPLGQGGLVGLTLLIGFAWPPLLRLKRVPTLRVLRREWEGAEAASLGVTLGGAAMLAALMVGMAGEWRLGLTIVLGFAGALLLFWLLARVLLALLAQLRPAGRGYGWRHGLANLRRRLSATLVQAVALALGLTALLLLTTVRGDLLASWQARVPPDAPNRFLINIQPEQRAALTDFFRTHGLPAPMLEPMVRARLVQVNGQPVSPSSYAEPRAQRLVEREFNLSWSERMPSGNRIVAGSWQSAGAPQFSVEQGLATTLNLQLGDRLRYQVAGQTVEATIGSLRKLDWDSMRVNFFVLAPPGLLEASPASYITSFHLPQGQAKFLPELLRAMPNLTVIDVEVVVKQLNGLLEQVAQAVQLIFGFALLAGLAVLYAALQASADERRHEIAVLRALGARQGQLTSALLAEFAVLGALAGLIAGLVASVIGWALAHFAFQLDGYWPSPELWIWGMLLGGGLTTMAGWLGVRSMMKQPAGAALRGG